MKLRKPTPDPPRPRILPGPGSSPAPEPPRPWNLPGTGSRQPGPRRPGTGGVLRTVGSSSSSSPGPCGSSSRCRYSRSRRSCMRGPGVPRPAGAGGRVSGPDPGGSPDTASPLVRAAAPELPGKRPRGSRRGCHLDPRRPQGVRTRSVRVGPGAAVADADRAQGECGPGKVVQRAHGGALLFGQLAFRWTTAVRPSFSSAKCTSRRPGRSGVGRRGPRDRRVTRENVT